MNKLSRSISELMGKKDTGMYSGVSDIASDMMKSLTVSDEKLQKLQEQYQDSLKQEEKLKVKHHKEILRVIIAATKKKAKAQKKLQEKVEKEKKKQEEKAKREEAKKEKPARKPAEKPAEKPTAKPAEAPKPEAPKPTAKPAEAPAPKPAEAPKPAPTAKPVEAPPTAPTAKPVTPKAPPAVKLPSPTAGKSLVVAALAAAGYSTAAQANVLANVDKESGFVPRSEELGKYSAKTLYRLYGPPGAEGGQPLDGKNRVRFKTIEEAQSVVSSGPEAVGEVLYGMRKDLGNDQPGDGYKYRGRGYLQITGKDMYKRIGKEINVDLVSNPDLANDPQVAAKIIPAFFKLKLGNRKPSDLEDIQSVNKMVGSADVASREKRVSLAQNYKAELQGEKINTTSAENTNLVKDMQSAPSPTVIVQQNSQTTVNKTPMFTSAPKQELNPTMR